MKTKNGMSACTRFCTFCLGLFLCMFFLSSCDKEQGVIEDYAALVEEIESDGDNFTEKQWEDFSLRCDETESEMRECSFSKEQKQELRKLQGRMAAAIGKNSGKLLKDAAEDAIEQFKAFSQGLMEGLGDEDNE